MGDGGRLRDEGEGQMMELGLQTAQGQERVSKGGRDENGHYSDDGLET